MASRPTGKILTVVFLRLTLLIWNALNKPRHAGVLSVFMFPSLESLPLSPSLTLQRAASVGSVTAGNTNKYSCQCDALVCRSHKDVRATMADMTRELESFLRKP